MAEAAAADPRQPPERLLASDLADDMGFLLARASAATSRAANVALAPLGLRVRSLSVLWLASQGLRPTQRELSDFLDLDPSQTVGLVDDLQQRGLIRREPDERDRRSRIVVATPQGKRLLRRAVAAAQAAGDTSAEHLTDDERKTLLGLLTRIAFPAPEPPPDGAS